MTLAEAVSELEDLHDLDLTEAEAARLLNEAHREMCVRAEWTRKRIEFGPTVADQAAYALPDEVYRPLKVYVEGLPLTPSSEEEVSRIGTDLRRVARGLWYIDHDTNGDQAIYVHPVPDAGSALDALCVVYPAVLTDPDEFGVPFDFQRALINYARGVALGSTDDDLEHMGANIQAFEGEVERLRRHRNARTGSGPVRMRILGRTA